MLERIGRFLGCAVDMNKAVAQFKLADGTPFLVEIDEPESSAIEQVAAVETDRMVYQAKQNLEQALDKVKPVASSVLSKLRSGLTTPADEISVSFGLKLSADAGVIFSSVGGEVTFQVTLKWSQPE